MSSLLSNSILEIKTALKNIPQKENIVFAFSDINSFEKYYPSCKEVMKDLPGSKLLALDYFLSKHLEERGIEHDRIYNDEMSEEHGGLFEQAEICAQNWFKEKETQKDFAIFKNLPLGYCLEILMFNFFQGVFKCIADAEIYLKRVKPDAVVYFNPGSQAGASPQLGTSSNMFERLFAFLCNRAHVNFSEIKVSAPQRRDVSGAGCSWFQLSPPVSMMGIRLRLPRLLYAVLKNVFLFAKNLLDKKYYQSGKPCLLVASPTSLNYLGMNIVEEILTTRKFNFFVWNGESRLPGVFNVLSQFSFLAMTQWFQGPSLRAEFERRFEADRDKLKLSTNFMGVPISDLYPDFFEQVYHVYFPQLACHAERVKKFLLKNKIKAIISHSDHSIFERMTLWVGNTLSVPGIYMQHGVDTPPANTILGYPSVARYRFVWGKVYKDRKVSRGEKENMVKIVGCPLHRFMDYQSEMNAIKLDAPGSFLFICLSGSQFYVDNRPTFKDNEDQLRVVLEAMRAFPQKTLIIKPRFHDMQIEIYRKLIKESDVGNVEIVETPIPQLLKECDLFFNVYSTAGLEGLIFDKPEIQFRFFYDNKVPLIKSTGTRHVPSADYGAALGLDTPDPKILIEMIKSIYQSETVREELRKGRIKFLEDHAHLGHGDPSQNFIAACEEIL